MTIFCTYTLVANYLMYAIIKIAEFLPGSVQVRKNVNSVQVS